MTVIIFIIVLASLIFVHELGHFLVARACGVRVDEFALGFGPRIWGTKRKVAIENVPAGEMVETEYALNLIPFGGYVKIFGENNHKNELSDQEKKVSFIGKNKWQQAAILVAGVVFNFIFAWLLIAITHVFHFAAPTDAFSRYADRVQDPHVQITAVVPNSPASIAGIMPGDRIVTEGDAHLKNSQDVRRLFESSEGKPVSIKVLRSTSDPVKDQANSQINGVENTNTNANTANGTLVPINITVTPAKDTKDGIYRIGIGLEDAGTLKLPVHLALYESVRFTASIMKDTAKGLLDLVAGAFTFSANVKDVAGLVGIAGMVGDAAKLGIGYLLIFTAFISINLGVLNLVPFPALDGGRLLIVFIESIFRKNIPVKITNVINTVGFAILMVLMVVITFNDIARLLK